MLRSRVLRKRLLEWYDRAQRELPWRGTRDPWRILLSEVMLQQTRVAAVIPYYERFLVRFPDARTLADAPEEELLALWSGLGYYSRARNLQRSARAIVECGEFPRSFEAIRSLPGVGDYTAAAVASIAFDLPHAVLDGNVVRVLSRLTAEQGDVLDKRRPGDFNQALMELGATVCLPRNPQCMLCPLLAQCAAHAAGIEAQLPVKLRARDMVRERIVLCLAERPGRVLMRRRPAGEVRLAGFWELPEAAHLRTAQRTEMLGQFRHSITRHDYSVEVWRAKVNKAPAGFRWVSREEMPRLPLTTMARKALALAGRKAASEVD